MCLVSADFTHVLQGCFTGTGAVMPYASANEVILENSPGPRLNIKTVLSTYGDFHVKDKMAVRTSYL